MKNTIYIFLFLISFQGVAQTFADKDYYLIDSLNLKELSAYDTQLIDSALTIFHKAKHDTSKIGALNIICENMMHNDWTKYQYYQQNLIEESLKKKIPPQTQKRLQHSLATSLNNLGYINIQKGEVLTGINYYEKALEIQQELNDSKGIAVSYNNIGLVHYNQGDIPTSLEYFHKSLKLKERIGNKKGIANSYTNIGGIYKILEDYDLALKYYLKAFKIEEELDNKKGIALCYNHIGFIYETKGDISLAKGYYQKSLVLVAGLGYKEGIAVSYGNLGNIYKMQNEIPLARKNLLKSLEIREELKDKRGIIISLIKIGQLDVDQNELKRAEQKSKRALKLAQEIGYPKLIKISAALVSQVYEKQGRGMEALQLFKIAKIMSDSLNNQTSQKASVRQQAKFEYEKQKVQDDAEHDKLIAIKQEEKEKQQVIIYATVAGLILIAGFLFFVFNRLRITRKQNRIIEAQKDVVELARKELEEKNQEITDSITYAKRIQDAILPTNQVVKELLPNSFIFYQPKDIVAGDFYWMESKDDYILFAAADCTGHGVPGAMVSVVCHTALHRVIRDYDLVDPGKILDKTREIIIDQLNRPGDSEGYSMSNMNDGMDIALCVLNTKTNQITYAGANNPLWILRDGGEEMEEIKATKQAIGRVENPISYQTHDLTLSKGDSIFVFSDGFADQFGGDKGKKLKYKPFKKLLVAMKDELMETQLHLIEDNFNNWKGNHDQVDDVCVIGVRI